jgi:para-nitrobenzyl esterase
MVGALQKIVLVFITVQLTFSFSALAETVKIDSGFVEGNLVDGISSFKGIPYAAPPIGHLRWRAPQPALPWSDVRKATEFGADCMQKPDPSDAAPLGKAPSEDCLFVNVWTPQNTAKKLFPVIVWIHGGGFVNGGSSASIYDGTSFAKKGLVFVSLNYRLGRFGFFAHPALTAAKEGPLGNYAMMDQIAALQWVRKNIAAFGGDPQQVTVMGESAGGISVLGLMTSQADQKLFQRAVVMSGGGRTWMLGGNNLNKGTSSAEQTGINFAESIGIRGADAGTLASLRALPAETIVGNLNMTTLIMDSSQLLIYAGGPINDGEILKAPPGEMLKQGRVSPIPLVIGTTGRDVSMEHAPTKEALFMQFGANAAQARGTYDPDGTRDLKDLRQDIGADKMMNEPARFVAKRMTALGNHAWLYRFEYVAESIRPQVKGAAHASELPFLFNTLSERYTAVTKDDQAAADAFGTYFANFAKGHDPNDGVLPLWEVFDPVTSNIMKFTLDRGPEMKPDTWKDRLDLIEELAEKPIQIK